jgi:hypothetical protein
MAGGTMSGLAELTATLDELVADEQELRTAIEAEAEALRENKTLQRQARMERLERLGEETQQHFESVMGPIDLLLAEPDLALLGRLQGELEALFEGAAEVVERCCEDAEITTLVHSLRDMRAAAQLFQGEAEDALEGHTPLDRASLTGMREQGGLLLDYCQNALQRAIDGLREAQLDDQVQVDAELTFALEDVTQRIADVRAQITKAMPPKPKSRRIKSTAPRKALPLPE